MRNKNGIGNDLIKTSLHEKDYDADHNKFLESKTVQVKDLLELVKSKNYSLITWINGRRKEKYFECATGFTIDVDEVLSLEEARECLDDKGYNYIIATSKSHSQQKDKYHILLFFSNPVYSVKAYKAINQKIHTTLFPESDHQVLDAARFIFGSPNDAIVEYNFDGKGFNVLAEDGLWNKSLEIITDDNETVTVDDLDGKTPCYCPFHDDSNPSAFVNYNEKSNNWYISCSTCGETLWMEKEIDNLESVLGPYYHYSKYIHELGIKGGEFFIHPIDTSFFHIATNTNGSKDERDAAYDELCKTKHISHLPRVDLLGTIDADKDYFQVNITEGLITVHYSPIKVDKKDNKFIDNYLEDRFGEYKQFIKEYLAVYCYTNYEKMPTLVFNSPRGNGKTTFVELVGSIYPHLCMAWNGIESDFNYEAEKKFLIVEENDTPGKKQYRAVKRYGGRKNATMNKKYQAPYQVRNNTNIAILSNERTAMYAKSSELPTDEKNNQFFVWEFPEFSEPINDKMDELLESHIGHYIRTEIKDVFESQKDKNGDCRYSIRVPITDYEKKMFKASKSPEEKATDEILEFIYHLDHSGDHQIYYDFLADGLLPQELIKSRLTINHQLIFDNLLEREYILDKTDRPMKDGKQYRCYYMDIKFIEKFNEAQKLKNK